MAVVEPKLPVNRAVKYASGSFPVSTRIIHPMNRPRSIDPADQANLLGFLTWSAFEILGFDFEFIEIPIIYLLPTISSGSLSSAFLSFVDIISIISPSWNTAILSHTAISSASSRENRIVAP